MNPPVPKRPRRASTTNSTPPKRDLALKSGDGDPQNSILLPPGTMSAVQHSGQLSQPAGASNPYTLSSFDAPYLDPLGLSRSFPYANPYGGGNYGSDPHAFAASIPQNYFYPSGYGMNPYQTQAAASASSLSQLPTTTTTTTATAQQQSSASYSTNLRGPVLPSPSRYVSNPMATLPSFPYAPQLYNPSPSWLGAGYATSPAAGASALPSSAASVMASASGTPTLPSQFPQQSLGIPQSQNNLPTNAQMVAQQNAASLLSLVPQARPVMKDEPQQ